MVTCEPENGNLYRHLRANLAGFVSGTITSGLEGAFGAALFYGIGSHFAKGAGAKGSGFWVQD